MSLFINKNMIYKQMRQNPFFSLDELKDFEYQVSEVLDEIKRHRINQYPVISIQNIFDRNISDKICFDLLNKLHQMQEERKMYDEWNCLINEIYLDKKEIKILMDICKICLEIYHQRSRQNQCCSDYIFNEIDYVPEGFKDHLRDLELLIGDENISDMS